MNPQVASFIKMDHVTITWVFLNYSVESITKHNLSNFYFTTLFCSSFRYLMTILFCFVVNLINAMTQSLGQLRS